MGASIFFFIESKTFKFLVKEGGTFYMLRIYQRCRDSLCSVFMGKESAKRLLASVSHISSVDPKPCVSMSTEMGPLVFLSSNEAEA